MKLHILYAILALATFAFGCAGKLPLPKQIPDALKAACEVYSKAKPQVIQAREYAKAHWNDKVPGTDTDVIPADVKKILQEFETYLPQLDAAGEALCAASDAASAFAANATNADGSKVDWNTVLTVAIKGIGVALDMHQKGVMKGLI